MVLIILELLPFALASLQEEQVFLPAPHFSELHTAQPAPICLLAANVGQMEKVYWANLLASSREEVS